MVFVPYFQLIFPPKNILPHRPVPTDPTSPRSELVRRLEASAAGARNGGAHQGSDATWGKGLTINGNLLLVGGAITILKSISSTKGRINQLSHIYQ